MSLKLHTFAALALALAASTAVADDFSILGGAARSEQAKKTSPAWLLSYEHELEGDFFGGFSYVNEGHFPGHHRDGLAAQVGVHTPKSASGWQMRVAAGPYAFFDTTVASGAGYRDAHGWGALVTAGILYQPHNNGTIYQLRVDRMAIPAIPDVYAVTAGVGFPLNQDGSFKDNAAPGYRHRPNEVTAYYGKTIVNSFESENANARSIEWRHTFGPLLKTTLSWVNEGDARLIRRNGIVAQAWVEPTFDEGRYSMGLGLGPYIAVDAYQPGQLHNLALLSATAAYRIAGSLSARLTWHRSISTYDRDSDIFLLGVGYKF